MDHIGIDVHKRESQIFDSPKVTHRLDTETTDARNFQSSTFMLFLHTPCPMRLMM